METAMNTVKMNFAMSLLIAMGLFACRESKEPVPNPGMFSDKAEIPVSLSEADQTITVLQDFEGLTSKDIHTNTDRENFAAACGVKINAGTYSYTFEKEGENIVITSIIGLDPFNVISNIALDLKKSRVKTETPAYRVIMDYGLDTHTDAEGKLVGTLNFSCYASKK